MLKVIGPTLLLLCACNRPSPWTMDQIHSDRAEFSFVKLCYHASDPVNGIDLEFVKNADQIQACLSVHSSPVPLYKGEEGSALVFIRTQEDSTHKTDFKCTALRLQGGQRLILPPAATEHLLSLLKNKEEVTILLGGYRTVLDCKDFEKKLETFLHPSSLRNPFQLTL